MPKNRRVDNCTRLDLLKKWCFFNKWTQTIVKKRCLKIILQFGNTLTFVFNKSCKLYKLTLHRFNKRVHQASKKHTIRGNAQEAPAKTKEPIIIANRGR